MPDIENTVESINSIKYKYPDLRQSSKNISFAKTYAGTWITLVNNCGLTPENAKRIEERYDELYKVSKEWVHQKIVQAQKDGYVTGAFGLRVRTPILSKTKGNYEKDSKASAEARTAGNALGQGWGLLNDRAMNAVLSRAKEAGYQYDILPVCKIHDATYYLVRNKAHIVAWLNNVIVEEAKWQDHPVIYHPEVGLSANMDIFYPTWADQISLPDKINPVELIKLMNDKVNSNDTGDTN